MDGRWSRWAKLGSLTSRMTGHRVRERLFGTTDRAAAARELADALSQLKGAAMKVGQQAALAASALDLPAEVQGALKRLEKDAAPVPWDTVEAILERELDAPPHELFQSIERRPLGTASLAQAHAAVLPDGTEAVVKVLHPGVLEGLEADLLALRAILAGGRLVGRRDAELRAIQDEVEARLREEVDYLQEAANLALFARLFAGDPRIAVPTPHVDLCTRRVLVMSRVPGRPLDAFLADAGPEARQRAGWSLAELFFEMAFVHRALHADPHPGNLLFQADGTVGFVDFGCVKRFDEFFLGRYAAAVLAALDGDRARTLDAARELGVWSGGTPAAGEAIWRFCDAAMAPWRGGPCVLGHDEHLLVRCQDAATDLWKYPEVAGVADMLYLHRALAGLYVVARTTRVEGDWGGLLRQHLTRAVAVAAGHGGMAAAG